MVFSSLIFLCGFLPVVIVSYYFLGEDKRLYWLLLASLFFYAWGEPKNLGLMLLICLICFSGAKLMNKVENSIKRKLILTGNIVLLLMSLGYYKYFDFIAKNINVFLGTSIEMHDVTLPIGISFFTFQAISYIVDVYRGTVKVQNSLFKVGLYISFFPQLIAGPIVKYHDIAKDMDRHHSDFADFVYGLRRFIVGLGKKVLIANPLGEIADNIFGSGAAYIDMPIAWLGAICYSLQLFYDFSGYSDMAIGLGRIFGFHFLENFNYPYISKSITEFWRRWHISLGMWFKEYVYISLGGNRVSNFRTYGNLFIVFLVTGIWHGANWTFIVWGLWHGFFIIIERALGIKKANENRYVVFRHLYTILVFVIGWTMFRAESVSEGIRFIATMLGMAEPVTIAVTADYYYTLPNILQITMAILLATPLAGSIFDKMKNGITLQQNIYDVGIVALLILVMANLAVSTYNPFIYFRF